MEQLTAFKTYLTGPLTAVQTAIDNFPDAGMHHSVLQPEAAEPEITPEQAALAEKFRNYLQKIGIEPRFM